MKLPENYKPVFASEEIDSAITAQSLQISEWFEKVSRETGKDPIAVPILRGALFFAAEILKKVRASCEIQPLSVKSYLKNKKVQDPVFDLIDWCKDRHILLIDDICETGSTLANLSKDLISQGALEVKSIVLIKRVVDSSINPDWVCFEYRGSEWLVGYGMDDNERFRNLSTVYKMV